MNTSHPEQRDLARDALLSRRQAILTMIRDHLHQSDDPSLVALRQGGAENDEQRVLAALGELAIAQLDSEFGELREIDAALARIEDGSYGKCLSCGELVPGERLRAVPSARYCVACQRESERRGTPIA